jgi:hypothetical protein
MYWGQLFPAASERNIREKGRDWQVNNYGCQVALTLGEEVYQSKGLNRRFTRVEKLKSFLSFLVLKCLFLSSCCTRDTTKD